VILAGGLGTRLRPYTLFVPKPMLPVGNRPILEHILEWLRTNGIKEVVISTGYLGKTIQNHFGDGSAWSMKLDYATSNRPLGIAGQLRNAAPKLPQRFVCLYGDAIMDFDLRRMMRYHGEKNALLTMALMRHRVQLRYGVIELEKRGRITAWKEKPVVESEINVGCYVMEKGYLDYIQPSPVAGMKEAFDAAMEKGEPLYGFKAKGSFWDIGDKEAFREADEHFQRLYGRVP